MKDDILAYIYDVMDRLSSENKLKNSLAKSPNTILFGKDGQLDSLGLINLIVGIEEKIEGDFGEAITLVDDRALSLKASPFQTVATLAEYIEILIKEKKSERQ